MIKTCTFALIGAVGALALASSPDARELKFAHQSTENHINHRSALVFKDEVEKGTKGSLTVRVFPNKQLGGERDEIEGMLIGTVDGSKPATAVIANWVPELNIANMPFVFNDLDHFERAWAGPLRGAITEKAAAKGLRFLCAMTTGVRNIMSKRPINSIDDMKGMKIRAIENPVHVATFNAFGGKATAIAYPELYGALQTGVVDGADAANANYWEQKFYEQAPHWALVNWLVFTNAMLLSEKTWKGLNADEQKAVQAAGDKACKFQNDGFRTEDDDALKKLLEKGVKVARPDRAPFIKAAQQVYDQFLKTEDDKKLLALIQNTK